MTLESVGSSFLCCAAASTCCFHDPYHVRRCRSFYRRCCYSVLADCASAVVGFAAVVGRRSGLGADASTEAQDLLSSS